jgi:hypothetical protein
VVYIAADAGQSAAQLTGGGGPNVYYNHQRIQFTSVGEWYYVRINGVTAPSVAGKYFFKILLGNSADGFFGGEEGVNQAGAYGMSPTQFIPTENWPVLLVKGEIDPAIITGTIRYAGYNATLYSQPVQEAGKVWAQMTTRLDPYTGQQRPDLPLVNAVGYFNATADGHYEVEGVAPGIYDLYASAAGFPSTLIASGVTILKGQSLHFDGYLQPGAVIHGNVFSKHQFGDEPWPATTYVKIELYNAPTNNHIPDPSAGPPVSWSPLPCVAGGQERFFPKRDAGYCNDPRFGDNIAFPWHEYVPTNGYGSPSAPGGATVANGEVMTNHGFYQVASDGILGGGTGTPVNYGNLYTQDPMGVGPPQHWFVTGGTTTPFHFEFGVKGEYGAPQQLDGMVPQVYATWVNGLTPGRYYARAWIFRYVQSALDGSTFQEYYFDITPNEWAGDVSLPMDLRLSSWVNKTVHFHNVVNGITEDPIDTGAGEMAGVLCSPCTPGSAVVWSYNQTLLGYKGLYTDGLESGWQAGAFSDPTTLRHENDLDKAKLNQFAIETGRANIQFWGFNDTWSGENYGIPSGTYQPHIFVLGYIENSPVDSVSVTLSGNPTSISDHVYRGAGFNVTIYSIDWERPTVARNWIWGQWGDGQPPATSCGTNGCSVNSGQQPFQWGEGYVADGLWSSAPIVTPGSIENTKGRMNGQEIDVAIYNNGSLIDYVGDETSLLADTTPTSCLFQNDTTSFVQMCGGGWDVSVPGPGISPNAGGKGYLAYQGNTNDAFFGQELKRLGFVGGYASGSFWTLTQKKLGGNALAHYSPSAVPGTPDAVYNSAYAGFISLYPSALPTPQQYDLRAFTYGYIQDQDFSTYASSGQVGDMRINLIIGVNVTLDILFKKEHIITPTSDNMSARVRLFDDSGNLVGEWMSSEGTYVTGTGFARAADGTTQFPFNNLGDIPSGGGAVPYPKALNGYNYLPGGVTLLHVLMAGLPQVPAAGQNDAPDASFLPKGTYFMDPILAPGCDFENDCYNSPGTSWNNPGYFPNTGILGAPDYQGGWTAEVDFVNWYMNNSGTPELLASDSNGGTPTNTQFSSGPTPATTITSEALNGQFAQYYPPTDGLLMGESYHIIPGTTAKSGISLTEDLATNTAWNAVGWSVGHSMAPNHLGPYSQEGTWAISGAHNSGEASAIFEVDLNGFVSGNALAFSWAQEFRPLSWATVSIAGASGGVSFTQYTFDGMYQTYLPPGTYSFAISAPGFATQSWSVAVTSGQTGSGQDVYLQQSNIPVPEFSGIAVVAFSALAASLYLLRRRRK